MVKRKTGKNKQAPVCEEKIINAETVSEVLKTLPKQEAIIDVSLVFKALSDPTRIKIIASLLQNELCVCDIAAVIGTTNSNISHQLRVLRNLGLVKYRKEGKMVYYSLDDHHVSQLMEVAFKHISE